MPIKDIINAMEPSFESNLPSRKVENQIEEKRVKEGVDFVFEENPELATIGTKEQYSSYLETIFPDSQIKDIVYHGTDSEKFEEFDKSRSGSGSRNTINTQDIFFIKYSEATRTFGKNLVSALINLREPNTIPLPEFNRNWSDKELYESQRKGDGIIGIEEKTPEQYYQEALAEYDNDPNDRFARKPNAPSDFIEEQLSTTYVVYNPEQIHILGSQKDIENFKNFVS